MRLERASLIVAASCPAAAPPAQHVHLVTDIHAGPSTSYPAVFEVLGSEIFFQADDGIRGTEPWTLRPSRAD